ncbi:WD40 repeat-containing protein [Tieghemostelium lacteum]|uniref:Protein HIRA n=1 Tax=Tieghemostelium lacteum TaxID=361077 RepID=A0A151Z491_TIELA|nr:WD40 repeat-containing protein [Tieghemostelium lacteum]|eukprot:KYQ88779.1 WD40 repeat-containing protein [Tieghemostelium lacteum]
MKILKPSWINHSGFPIFSVDIHPDGTRLATGGGDNKAKIWSIAPITVEEVEEDNNVPKLLKTCEGHFSPVNSVKWSNDGKYLATGSDDKLVIIWGLSSNSLDFSFGDQITVENWVCVHTLRGHAADISEVQWSPDSRFLASCSFDKTIIIWETSKFQIVKKIRRTYRHTSQSDDKSVIIWRVSDWQVETKITEPYQHNEQSFFNRLSWAPDGQFLCTPHGISDHTHVSVIIQRSNWERGYLVGHKKATVVVRYSPIIYKSKLEKQPACCILVGGKDSTVSLWSSSSPRALMITTQFFTQSIQDISWCPDGYSFVICSTDGSIGYISLSSNDLNGQLPITTSEKTSLFRSIYGDAVKVAKDGTLILSSHQSGSLNMDLNGGGNHSMFVENPDQLELEENDRPLNGHRSLLKSSTSSNGSSSGSPLPVRIQPTQMALQNQKQTVTSTGKRRITPLHIGGGSQQSITTPAPISIPLHLQHSNETNNNINNNNNNDDIIMNDTNGVSSTTTTPIKDNSISTVSTSPTSSTTTGEGSGKTIPSPKNLSSILQNKRKAQEALKEKSDESVSTITTIENNQKKLKTKRTPENISSIQNSLIPKPNTNNLPIQPNQNINNNINSNNSNIYISPPIPLQQKSKQLTSNLFEFYSNNQNQSSSNNNQNIILDVNVAEQELFDFSVEYFSVIKCFSDSQLTWENKIAGRVNLLTGNRNWSAVATTDSTIQIYNRYGSIIMSNLVLRNPISYLEANNKSHLMAITCDGYVSVWNVHKKKAELSNRELPFLMNKENLTIRHCMVTEDSGKPVLTFSNGDSFVYSTDLGEWIKITDRLGSLSEFNSNDTNATGILSKLQSTSNFTSGASSGNGTLSSLLSLSDQQIQKETPHQQQNLTTTYLEKQLWLATVLESPSEYKHWLKIYVQHLTKHGNLIKLQELCSDFLGPSSNLLDGSQWDAVILSFDKRTLLNEILPLIASNRALQRLVYQYKESLSAYSKSMLDPF